MTERAPKKPKILCAGIAVQDIVMRVQSFPVPGTKVAASDFIITGGGCAANAAVTIARLNGRVAFAGPLGGANDAVSNQILFDLEKEGVDCTGVTRVDDGTASVSLILLDATGEKTIATRRGVKLGDVSPNDPVNLTADADAILVDNRFPHFATEVCRAAQARKILIVIDLDQATKMEDPLLAFGTHVVASAEALFAMTGSKDYKGALKGLAEHLAGFVAITDGPKGVYWLEGAELRHLPAFKVKAIDSLGAGDAFHGGFTLALAEGRPLPEILRFASATAALKCTKFGGASGTPTRAEVEAFLKHKS
ncbi:MAG TPA: PfkB family carbohydrate kinase [Pseudolabrys sp.]|nr:PfkB family carbohydrate kinase [Pseudolabrys sp.]